MVCWVAFFSATNSPSAILNLKTKIFSESQNFTILLFSIITPSTYLTCWKFHFFLSICYLTPQTIYSCWLSKQALSSSSYVKNWTSWSPFSLLYLVVISPCHDLYTFLAFNLPKTFAKDYILHYSILESIYKKGQSFKVVVVTRVLILQDLIENLA